jgi:hypothetical protein
MKHTMKVIEKERRQCGKCGLVGDWKIYKDGRTQKACAHCGIVGCSSNKIS